MTRIDFYILETDSAEQRYLFACRLAEKAWRLGHPVHMLARDASEAERLDQLLWSFRPEAFVPHARTPAPKHTPIHIGHGEDPGVHHGLLVNLGNQVPPAFSRFERVAEIVNQLPDILHASRERYRQYRDRGYEIGNHRIASKGTP